MTASANPQDQPSRASVIFTYLAALPCLAGALGVWLLASPRREAALTLLNSYIATLVVLIAATVYAANRNLAPGRDWARGLAPGLLVISAWLAMNLPAGGGLVLSSAALLLGLWLNRPGHGHRYFNLQCKFTTIVLLASGLSVWALI